MNVNKMTPQWFVQGDVLRLSIHYWKRNETSDGHSGCSSNWMRKMEDGDFVTAYNWIVDAAKEQFHLPNMKKIKVEKKEVPTTKIIYRNNDDQTIAFAGIVFVSLVIGAVIGSIFF